VLPVQMESEPEMGLTKLLALTVIPVVAVADPQALVTTYRMESVPDTIAVTNPEVDIVATEGLSDNQYPPGCASVTVPVSVGQKTEVPEITPAMGAALIVIVSFAVSTPHKLEIA
jgi:hypothetical protein